LNHFVPSFSKLEKGTKDMSRLTVVFGNGAIGHLVTNILLARGDRVRIAQRKRPTELPAGAEHIVCDVLNQEDVRRAVQGASQVLLAVGFTYDSRVWKTVWPKTITNIVEACADVDAKVVWIDNLYQLGPQTKPRTEDMALSTASAKAVSLIEATDIWMAARNRVRFAALRCPDFYGPGVEVSHIGDNAFGALARGKTALLLAPPDTPHDFAYAPDIARAVVTLFDASDDAYGQVWNVPCAPTKTPREILKIGADATGARLKVLAIPLWLLPLLGFFDRFLKETWDVRYTWDRPYMVDGGKFTKRFGFNPTSFEVGVPLTARAFVERARHTTAGM
jgi:nucleoside-diphosphate-sugar epimerase